MNYGFPKKIEETLWNYIKKKIHFLCVSNVRKVD